LLLQLLILNVSYNSSLFMENSDYFPSKVVPCIIRQNLLGYQRVAVGFFIVVKSLTELIT